MPNGGFRWGGIAYKARALPPPPEMPATYTVGQVAEACQVTPETVRTWIRKGKLRALTLPSGRHRIARDEVTRLLERYG